MPDKKSVVIVALPAGGDPIWQMSSEKAPHLTVLFLGESDNTAPVEAYLKTLATDLAPFTVPVVRRDVLGKDSADVAMLGGPGLDDIRAARSQMLEQDHIRNAVDSVDQYPEWTPHVTLGYPETPSPSPLSPKDITFDRLALWTGDSEGPTFRLRGGNAMAQSAEDLIGGILEHHGVKGQKWGITRATVTGGSDGFVRALRPGNKPQKTDSADTTTVRSLTRKKGGTAALSNKELKELVTRMQLERQYKDLKTQNSKLSAGEKWLSNVLGQAVSQTLAGAANAGLQAVIRSQTGGRSQRGTTYRAQQMGPKMIKATVRAISAG